MEEEEGRKRERREREERERRRERGEEEEESISLENEPSCLFSGVVTGVGGQGGSYPPKTSRRARSWGLCVVVVAKERLAFRKRAQQLVFGSCEWWWSAGRSQPPENEPPHLFSGVVGGKGGRRTPKTRRKGTSLMFERRGRVLIMRNAPRQACFSCFWGEKQTNTVLQDVGGGVSCGGPGHDIWARFSCFSCSGKKGWCKGDCQFRSG
jgi:hypothetical protein